MALKLTDYRLLGRSGLRVSPLSLGAMTFGVPPGTWGSSDAEAKTMVDLFLDRGGNFIDTANFYAQGGSERVMAPLLAGRRDRIVLATKYSLSMRTGDPNASGNQRKSMVRAVEDSLKRLETDYIDLLYLHMWDGLTPVDEILRAFDDLVRAGKILYVGLSDTPAWQASRMQAIAELRGWAPIVAMQLPYNLTQRTVERELLPMAREMGIGVLPWSPLAGGVLSGKYSDADLGGEGLKPGEAPQSRKAMNIATGRLTAANLEIARAVGQVAREIGVSSAQVALAWTLLHPAVTSTILGARTPAQLEDNLAALDVELSADQVAKLDAVSRIEMGFPHNLLENAGTKAILGTANVRPN